MGGLLENLVYIYSNGVHVCVCVCAAVYITAICYCCGGKTCAVRILSRKSLEFVEYVN